MTALLHMARRRKKPGGGGAPAFASSEIGTVNGYTIVVTFSEDIVSADYKAGWTYKENGVTVPITSAERQANHAVVHFVVPVPWHGSADTLTLAYNSATGDYASESGAVDLGTFTAQTVTNNIGWVALLDLQSDTGVTTSVAPFSGTGLITQSDNDITGAGTFARRELVVGDRVQAVGIDGIVTAITDDTHFAIDTSATVAVGVIFTVTPQSGTARINTHADLSGNGHDFTQSGTARPSLQTIGGYPVVVCDGRNDLMVGSDFAIVPPFAAVQVYDTSTYAEIYKIGNYGCDNPGSKGWTITGEFIQLYEDTSKQLFQSIGVSIGAEKHVATGEIISNTELHTYFDGVQADGYPNGGNDFDSGGVADFSNNDAVRLNADGTDGQCGGLNRSKVYARLLVQISNLTKWNATDRAALETRLGARYGVTI